MHTLLLLALLIWPFAPSHRTHSRAYHARHLRHLQEARAQRLSHRHGAAHHSLVRFR